MQPVFDMKRIRLCGKMRVFFPSRKNTTAMMHLLDQKQIILGVTRLGPCRRGDGAQVAI